MLFIPLTGPVVLNALNIFWWLEMQDNHLCQICRAQAERGLSAALLG